MQPEHATTEALRRATASIVKVLSGRDDVSVSYGTDATPSDEAVRLPFPPASLDPRALAPFRGAADAGALRLRFHDAALHATLQPDHPVERRLFDAAEQARVEALGALRFPGVALNLDARRRVASAHLKTLETDGFSVEGLALLVYLLLTEARPRTWASLDRMLSSLPAGLRDRLSPLHERMEDQAAFGQALRDFVEAAVPLLAEPLGGNTGAGTTNTGLVLPGAPAPPGTDLPESDVVRPDAPDAVPAAPQAERPDSPGGDAYHAYTTRYDEVLPAERLASPDALRRLRQELDRAAEPFHHVVARLANRLQRLLLGQQRRAWLLDQEEGLLDPSRLARIIASPMYPLRYRYEREGPFKSTAITLLVDNSGSMRGTPILLAALCADILARTLERCGIHLEILGYTTRTTDGGRPYAAWQQAGRPASAGRLCELRHIVYKDAQTPWRRARQSLALMLQEELLQENVDGEALRWAAGRLLSRPESRHLLVVLSDGAPRDRATEEANGRSYLLDHLRETISFIEERTPIEMLAIGLGHDVTRFYQRAFTLYDTEHLGEALVRGFTELIALPPAPRR